MVSVIRVWVMVPCMCMGMGDMMHLDRRIRGDRSCVMGMVRGITSMSSRYSRAGCGRWRLRHRYLVWLKVVDNGHGIRISGKWIVRMNINRRGVALWKIIIVHILIVFWVSRVGMYGSRQLLGSDFVCCKEATTRTAWAAHSVLVPRFVEIRLALTRQSVHLLKAGASDATF